MSSMRLRIGEQPLLGGWYKIRRSLMTHRRFAFKQSGDEETLADAVPAA